MSDNPPRPYDLTSHAEGLRLVREVRGYLHTCHRQHGTDWQGRQYAMDALDEILRTSASLVEEPRVMTPFDVEQSPREKPDLSRERAIVSEAMIPPAPDDRLDKGNR